MKSIYCIGILFSIILIGFNSNAQIAVNGGLTAQQLANILAGPNITVTNAVLTGSGVASGSFSGNGVSIGFDSGIILSTGNINEAPGPNTNTNTGANLGMPGTPQMNTIAGVTTYDAITLEFDFEVQSESIQFNYVFSSEEYPEYAPPNNSNFNDVFAFFISGPGILGDENIALVPNSTDPVSINNINPVTNSQYYINNAGGQDIEFDGYTTVLEAKRNNLTPCEVYHLKLVICDAGDGVYSSAVFLQENSLIQGIVEVQTQTVNSDNVALEGCIPASFTFSFDDISNQDRIINYTVGGTALNGVDYQYVDSSMTIFAGDLSATIYINAFSDGITEGQESVWIIYQPAPCAPYDTAFLFINDAQPIDFSLDGFNLDCFDDNTGEIQVNATGGFPPYTFYVTNPDGSETQTLTNPISGLSAGTYSVNVYDSYGCKADALVIGGVFDADTTFLPDVPNGVISTYEAPLEILGFNAGQTITDVSQIQQICLTMEHSYLGDLEIAVQSPSGQILILKEQNGGGSCDLGEPFASGPVDGANSNLTDPGVGYEYCFNASPIFGTMVQESANYTHTIPSSTGGTYTDNYLPAGSYTAFQSFNALVGSEMNGIWSVLVTDQFALDNGYIFNWYISLIGDMPDTLVTLLEPDEIVTTAFVTNSTCGGSDGAINTSIVGAEAPYTVLWSNGETTENLTGIAAGTYTLTVTDANGCQSAETFLVNNIGSLDISATSSQTSCNGGNDGAIDVTVTGGQTPYSFNWNSGQTTEDLSGIIAGNYIVTVTDQMGCIISETVTVTDATPIQINTISVQNEACNTDNGAIQISATGGSGSYGYQWSSGQGTQNIANLSSGTYSVDVIDGNGCTAQNSYTLINDVSNCSAFCYIDIEANILTNEVCGSGNGSIDITVLNAVAPLSYSWSNGSITEDISGLTAGDYTVVVTDANNCSEVQTFTIINQAANLAVSGATIGEDNCGNSNGSINITIAGGALPYSYSWSNGETTQDLTNLTAGSYSVTITDGNGCMISSNYTVNNNAGTLSVTATVNPELCISSNGSINQTVNGGNGTLTYAWSTGQTTQDLTGLATGTYTCVTTDQTGCYVENTYTVGQLSGDVSLVGSIVTNETCGNGQGAINVTFTGNNLSFLWSNGATTEDISGIPAGNYSVTASNLQGCSYTSDDIIVINTAGSLSVTTQLITNELCAGENGAININVSSGTAPYTFVWTNGAVTEDIINLTAGTYSVTVSDANGCIENHAYSVGSSSGTLAIDNALITNENCGNNAGAVDVILAGGTAPLTYIWSNGATTQDVTGLAAGVYSIEITDVNGCSVNESYTINNIANNLAFTSLVTNEICSNGQGEISLNVTGGTAPYSYTWSNSGSAATVSNLSSGNYSCTITDNTGCSIVSGNISIGNTPNGMTSTAVITNANCGPNGSIDITVLGGNAPYTYSWSNGATTQDIFNLSAGQFTYTITDNANCIVSGTGSVIETNGSIDYDFTTTSEICGNNAGEINLSPTGGTTPYSFLWNNGETTQNISGLSAGNYTCVVTDNNGCAITTGPISITNSSGNLNISNVIATNETCNNGLGSIDISTTGGTAPITYLWSTGATTEDIINLGSGIYSVVVSDANGCEATTQAVINSSSGSLAIVQPIITHESCSAGNGSINISITGQANPVSYLWSSGATTQDISALTAGIYTVSLTDANGCSTNGSYTVLNSGTSLAISNTTITDEYCSSSTGSITAVVTGGSAPYSYAWSNGGTTNSINNLSAGTYNLTVTEANGCQTVGAYVVNNNVGNLSLNGSIINETCGDGTGEINIVTNGGNMPITYSWNNGATTEDLSNLNAGTYELTASDNYGCQTIFSGLVENITAGLNVEITTITDESCGQSDGAIDATIAGTGIVSTVWSTGQTTEDISGLSSGTYTLTVTNSDGCIATANAVVQNQSGSLAISFSNIGNETCINGQGFVDIEVTGAGPFSYAWSNGETTQDIINLSSGSYSVVVTDGVGCMVTQSYTVNNINSSNINASSIITDAYCSANNGAINLTVSGGIQPYSYSWNTGQSSEDLTNIGSGAYIVTITDQVNCSFTQTVNVGSLNSGLQFTNLAIQDDACGVGNGSVTFFTGGTADDYYLDGTNLGGWFAGNLFEGTYLVAISDNFGCYVDSLITVGGSFPFLGSGIVTDASCATCPDGAINVTLNGSSTYNYSWSNGGTTQDISGLTPGAYNVFITSAEGCDTMMTFNVNNLASLEDLPAMDVHLSLQPNPANNHFFVNYTLPEGQYGKISITDALGKIIQVIDVHGENQVLVNATDMATGMYFITLSSQKERLVERIVINKF